MKKSINQSINQSIIQNKKLRQIYLLFILSVFLSSCSKKVYVPKTNITLQEKTVTIPKTIRLEQFVGDIPHTKVPLFSTGIDLESVEIDSRFKADLTTAMINDFEQNKLFQIVSKDFDNPDFVIKGTIKKYDIKARVTNFYIINTGVEAVALGVFFATGSEIAVAVISASLLLDLAGVPLYRNETDIVLELEVYDKNNNKIATYTALANKFVRSNIYNYPKKGIKNADNCLTLVAQQLREQIQADIVKFN